MPDWNQKQYLKFASERTRAAIELMSRVPLDKVDNAVDLGCGPGNSTVILKERFPQAKITAVDNSPGMLAKAKDSYPDITFVEGTIEKWQTTSPTDLIFANAAFQWLDEHERLLPHLVSQLSVDGILAFQMPRNFDAPTHTCMREIAANSQWSERFEDMRPIYVKDPGFYYSILCPIARDIDIWETEYYHVMNSVDDIIEWVKGTGLRPFLEPLTEDEQKEFISFYRDELLDYYQPQKDGKVVMPFRRLFAVCRR
jgi:trans-aconitate 2-methyltransferase